MQDITSDEDIIIQNMADFLKVFGDYTRIRILECIMDIRCTVNEIADYLDITPSAVSHHLKILKQEKLVVAERGGKYVYYIVADKHVKEIYNLARAHIEEFTKAISANKEHDEMWRIFEKELEKEIHS